jgi:hypothetical protein
MQTTKFLFGLGLVATLAAFALTSGARDTEEQRQARLVLRQKMAELDAADAATTRSATADARPPAATPRTAAGAAAPVTTVATAASARPLVFAPVPDAVADANATQLRDALRQAMTALEYSPGDGRFAAVPAATADANAAQLRDALRRTMANLSKYPPSRALAASTGLVMEAPLSPLSGSKSARLSVLLERYTADQITPQEYHTQRAAIVAEP